jgi:hypothetical protein
MLPRSSFRRICDSIFGSKLCAVTGRNLPTLCADFRTNHPGDNVVIISNKVSMLADTMPHVTARGSNDLIGRNVLQTMTFMTPDEYEGPQGLNSTSDGPMLAHSHHDLRLNVGKRFGQRSSTSKPPMM